jgi:uncharacterized membrane protein
MSPLIRGFADRGRQRGAIGLMAAVTLALAVLCMLLVIDSGRLYLEKRSLQRVADVSALEAATRAGQCTPISTAPGYAITAATRNGFTVTDGTRTLTTNCGTLTLDPNNLRIFTANPAQNQAIRVVVTHSVARSIAAGVAALFPGGVSDPNITLSATAVATKALPPLASLTIRTTLLTVDSSKSAALNALFGGLLGGNLNLSVAGWQGLANANINLLSYLNQLAIDTHVAAGDYTTLLSSNITLAQLLSTAATVLPQNDPAVQAAISGLGSIQAIAGNTTVQLQNLLNLQTGTPTAGLNLNMNLFQLVEGEVQLANSQSALYATIPANILGLVGVTAKIKVIEPPQLSAAGDPSLAKANPTGPNQIYVRTAQVRTWLSVDLSSINQTLQGINTILAGLSLIGVDLQVAPKGLSLDINLEIASASSYVTDYTCVNSTNKSLTTNITTAAANLKVGQIANQSAWSSSTSNVTVNELPLIDIETGNPRVMYGGGGIGILVNSPILASSTSHLFTNPPEINLPPDPYFSTSSQYLVDSLRTTLSGVQVINHPPQSPGLLGLLFGLVTSTLSGVINLLGSAIDTLLSPILDPLLNLLLQSLGINLAEVDVGANLSCSPGQAVLVI